MASAPDESGEGSRGFGFERPDDAWLRRVREAESPRALGSIGPYELLEEVGRGGQGVVFQAWQPGTRRKIALKRLIAGAFAGTAARRRFEREIEAATALDHPNVVTVYGVEYVDGEPILAMQWIDGVPVNAWAENERRAGRAEEELLATFLEICGAVGHAHQHGVIHRDLKPSNILVDAQGRPHVLDFGLAKLVDGERSEGRATLTGAFAGTPAYSSPEQVRGERAIDVRTDVYSLGVVLYEMLTGALPHDPGGGVAEMLRSIEQDEPVRPSKRGARIGSDLEAILLKALESSRSKRYPSVEAFEADVRRMLAGEAIVAHPPSTWYALEKLVRRRWLALSIASTVAVLVIAFAAIVFRQNIRYAREVKEGEDVTATLVEILRGLGADASRGTERPGDRLDRSLALVDAKLEAHPEKRALLENVIGTLLLGHGRVRDADKVVREALQTIEDVDGRSGPSYALACRAFGALLAERAQYAEAERYLREALAIREANPAGDPAELASTLIDLADVERERARAKEALSHVERALPLARAAFGDASPEVARALRVRGGANVLAGELNEARASYEAALEILDRHASPSSELADALDELGNLSSIEGRFLDADATSARALDVRRAVSDPLHPSLARALLSRAEVLTDRVEQVEAERMLAEARAITERELGLNHPDIVRALLALARMCHKDADKEQYADWIERAYGIAVAIHGTEHPLVAAVLVHRAMYDPDPEGRWSTLTQALEMQERLLGPRHPQLADTLYTMAMSAGYDGRIDEARERYEDVLSRLRERDGAFDAHVPLVLNSYANLEFRAGKIARSRELYGESLALSREFLPPGHRETIDAMDGLSGILHREQRLAEIETLWRDALGEWTRGRAPEAWYEGYALAWIGWVRMKLDDFAGAEPELLRSLEVMEPHLGATSRRVAETVDSVIELYQRWGKTDLESQWHAKRESLVASAAKH